MSQTLLFERDALTASKTLYHWDDDTERFTLEDQQDVTSIIEGNKVIRSMDRAKNEVRPSARIPLNLWHAMRRKWDEQGLSWEERQTEMKKFLNDRDNAMFRTSDARV